MSYTRQPIHARLSAARRAIEGALANPEVLALLSARSYDKEAIKAGKSLYEKVRTLSQQTQRKRAGQFGATDAIKAQLERSRQAYIEDLALARVEFKHERGRGADLGLYGVRARSLSAWLAQAWHFYETLRADKQLAARLEPLGLEPAVLEERRTALKALETAQLQPSAAASIRNSHPGRTG